MLIVEEKGRAVAREMLLDQGAVFADPIVQPKIIRRLDPRNGRHLSKERLGVFLAIGNNI